MKGDFALTSKPIWQKGWKPTDLAQVRVSERVLKRYPALTPENWTCQVAWNAIRELSGELSKMLLGCEYPLHALAFWDRKKEEAFVVYPGEIEELLEAVNRTWGKDEG